MCGIVGYIGKSTNIGVGVEALRRLEYRGYDSAGIAVYSPERREISSVRSVGKISELDRKLSESTLAGSPMLLHTRWATHGEVTEENAHPHKDCKGNIFVVHNGIIENYKQLKEKLVQQGHTFSSETDTEVLAHLIEYFFKGNLEEATREALKLVRGSYGLAVIARDDPEKIVAARLSSPLVISVNENGAFVASDPSALVSYSKQMIFLDDGEVAILQANTYVVSDLANNIREKEAVELGWTLEEAQK